MPKLLYFTYPGNLLLALSNFVFTPQWGVLYWNTTKTCLEMRLKCWWSPYTHVQKSCIVVCYSKHGDSGCTHPALLVLLWGRYIHLVVDIWWYCNHYQLLSWDETKMLVTPLYTCSKELYCSLLLKTRRQRLHPPPALLVLLWGRYIILVVNF